MGIFSRFAGEGAGYSSEPTRTVTASSSVTSDKATGSDFFIQVNATAAALTEYVPSAVAVPQRIYVVKKTDASANAVTVADVGSGATIATLSAQGSAAMIQSDGIAWQLVLQSAAGGSAPSGNAGGDLSGTYPNPTVSKLHATSGNIDGVAIGSTTPAAGAFTTLNSTSANILGPLSAEGLNSTTNGNPSGTNNTGVNIGSSANWASATFYDSTRGADAKTADVVWQSGVFSIRFKNDAGSQATTCLSGTGAYNAITGIASNSGSGLWAHTGNMNVSGTFNATGTLGSSANNSIPSPTNSGVTIGGGSNWANAQFYDQAASANNRTAAFNWSGGTFSLWFRSDSGTSLTALAVSGGQGSGITGIASTSGSGAWAHTGSLTTTGLATLSQGFTVAALPAASTALKGARAFVTDAASPTWNSPVTGGSSNTVPVFCNGNAWVCG